MPAASAPLGLPAGVGAHDLPEHGVVNVPAGVIADGGPDRFGDNRAVIGEQLFHDSCSPVRARTQGLYSGW